MKLLFQYALTASATTRTGDGEYQNIPATDVVIHSVAQTR